MNIILHLGLGSFHRAHQAVYLHQLHQQGDGSWRLVGGNTRPGMEDTIAALIAQGGAYTLETISPADEHRYQRISAIQKVITYRPDLAELIAQGADPATRIISFTVTEAGYYLDAHNRLDLNFPDLAADVAAARAGRPGGTIYAALTAILRARMAASTQPQPLTLLSCDNLRHNGDRSRNGLLQFATLIGDTALRDWITSYTTSPNSMVDRITPRPTPQVVARVAQATGQHDPAALMSENFIQWVIEDDFIAGRPAWEKVGAEMVASVMPYEEAKIRLLNATHSCISWAGTLIGTRYIHESVHNAQILRFAYNYVTDDAIPCLLPNPLDLPKYRDVVLQRFANAAIQDTNQRVVMDSFSKIPGFIAPTFRDRLSRNASIAAVSVLPVLFLEFLQKWCAEQLPFAYQDQGMNPDTARSICTSPDPVAALAADVSLWGEMAQAPTLVAAFRQAHTQVRQWLSEYSQDTRT